jgi:hypothetical protein
MTYIKMLHIGIQMNQRFFFLHVATYCTYDKIWVFMAFL